MKNLRQVVLPLVISMTAAACCTPQAPVIVPKNVLITPPENLMLDCPVASPPSRDAFQAALKAKKYDDAIALMASAYSTQVANTDACNKSQAALRSWVKQQQSIYTTPPAGGK